MIFCVDVDYRGDTAVAAGVAFTDWSSGESLRDIVEFLSPVATYVPGQFYRRELPAILRVLRRLDEAPAVLVVDGYVWLGDESRPGLGGRLHEAVGRRGIVVGVAKTRFVGAAPVAEVFRGQSRRPLFVSVAGADLARAAQWIRAMHGEHRVPTLLRRVDRLCRTAAFTP